ncbi:MAG: hypothetical protein NC827_04910 [Candidatus Omnitrophica bacterium]|nr:hypothetical protein [Candidatus Omnitrophota bacterium]MCM8802632.1 hypothetical protein [Candidatus Omnitrophota bacterium]
MFNRKVKLGFTLITVLIGLFILASGIITLIKIYPVIMNLSERSKNFVNVSFIADKIFTMVEQIYGNKDNELPEYIEGVLNDYPDYRYKVNFIEERQDLYKVELEIYWKKEGKDERKYFVSSLRRR